MTVRFVSRWPCSGPFISGRFVSTGHITYVERPELVADIRQFASRYLACQLVGPPGGGITTALKDAAGTDPEELTVYINLARYLPGGSYSEADLVRARDQMLQYADACARGGAHTILVDNCGGLERRTYAKLLELERGYAEQHSADKTCFLNSCQVPIAGRPYVLLPPFTEEELAALLKRAHIRAVPEFTEAAQNELMALSGGWPEAIQMIAAATCDRGEPEQGPIGAAAVTASAHELAQNDEQLHELVAVARRHRRFLEALPPEGKSAKGMTSQPAVREMLSSGVLVFENDSVRSCHGLLDWMLKLDVRKRWLVTTPEGEREMSEHQVTALRAHPEKATIFLDMAQQRAWVQGHETRLTPASIRLLSCLLTKGSDGSIVTYDELHAAMGLSDQHDEPARADLASAQTFGNYRVADTLNHRVQVRIHNVRGQLSDALGGRALNLVEACPREGYRLSPDITFYIVRRA